MSGPKEAASKSTGVATASSSTGISVSPDPTKEKGASSSNFLDSKALSEISLAAQPEPGVLPDGPRKEILEKFLDEKNPKQLRLHAASKLAGTDDPTELRAIRHVLLRCDDADLAIGIVKGVLSKEPPSRVIENSGNETRFDFASLTPTLFVRLLGSVCKEKPYLRPIVLAHGLSWGGIETRQYVETRFLDELLALKSKDNTRPSPVLEVGLLPVLLGNDSFLANKAANLFHGTNHELSLHVLRTLFRYGRLIDSGLPENFKDPKERLTYTALVDLYGGRELDLSRRSMVGLALHACSHLETIKEIAHIAEKGIVTPRSLNVWGRLLSLKESVLGQTPQPFPEDIRQRAVNILRKSSHPDTAGLPHPEAYEAIKRLAESDDQSHPSNWARMLMQEFELIMQKPLQKAD